MNGLEAIIVGLVTTLLILTPPGVILSEERLEFQERLLSERAGSPL